MTVALGGDARKGGKGKSKGRNQEQENNGCTTTSVWPRSSIHKGFKFDEYGHNKAGDVMVMRRMLAQTVSDARLVL